MKDFKMISTSLLFVFFSVVASAKLSRKDIATWPKASVTEFGCFLEKDFSYKDERFNCSLKNYKNKGDPCLSTTVYYEGPKVPREVAKKINSKIESMDLIWEKGRLQSVALTLDAKYSEKEVRKLFELPAKAQISDCSAKNTCVTLVGFEHMGAGDVDCGDE